MAEGAPELIAIRHDDYHARYIGRTTDDRQFFLTTPFVRAVGAWLGREFLALYFLNLDGQLLEARIEDLGVRQPSALPGNVDERHSATLLESWLTELGTVTFCDIQVAPFRLVRFGTEFGLISVPPDDDFDHWRVELQPGDYMGFYPPWDGDYDT